VSTLLDSCRIIVLQNVPVFVPEHDGIQIVKEPQLRSQTNSYIATEIELSELLRSHRKSSFMKATKLKRKKEIDCMIHAVVAVAALCCPYAFTFFP
jgi:hypothetical protein